MSLTLGDFIDNMEKSGFPKITGKLYAYSYDPDTKASIQDIEKGGCALGQACWNTFHDYSQELGTDFIGTLDAIFNKQGRTFYEVVVTLNDNSTLSIEQIAKEVRHDFKDHLDKVLII
jgi:hypothetical protein